MEVNMTSGQHEHPEYRTQPHDHVDVDHTADHVDAKRHQREADAILVDHESRIAALEGAEPPVTPPVEPPTEPPVEPPTHPPVGRTPAPVRTLTGESGFTIDSELITRETPGYGLVLVNCHNFTINNVETRGGGIALFGCDNWTIRDGLQEQTHTGHPGWSDDELGIRLDNCHEGQILGNVGAYFDGIYQVRRSSDIDFDGNFTYNPRGPRWRGQHIQAWELDGTRNQRINIIDHWGLSDYTRPGKWPQFWQEDAINFSHVDDGRISNTLMEMRQLPGGSGSHSGSGLMFEGRSQGIEIDNFVSIGQANVGFGVASGSHVSMRNSFVHYLPTNQLGGEGHVGGFNTQSSRIDFGDNVRIYGTKPKTADNPTGAYGAFWESRPDSSHTGDPTFGNAESDEAMAYLAAVEPPISIPDVGFVLP